jgi:hypothetical protein
MHPFFNSNRFLMGRKDGAELLAQLLSVFRSSGEIRILFEQAGGDLTVLPDGLAPAELWPRVLNELARRRGLEAFCTQLQANANVKKNDELMAAVDAVIAAKPLLERQMVSDHALVLDRVELRSKMRLLADDESQLRVVLVRGDDDSGKSWGRHVFESASKDRDAVMVYVSGNQAPTLEIVIELLFAAVKATERIPDKLTTPAAWYASVCTRLSDVTGRAEKQLWIAIDDLALIDTEICAFCDQFVAMMENPAFATWFRLMLIDYPSDMRPTTWQNGVWDEDHTSMNDVQLDDVTSFFRNWADEAGYKLRDQGAEALAKDAIAKADAPDAPDRPPRARLQRLHDHLLTTLAEQTKQFAGAADPPER